MLAGFCRMAFDGFFSLNMQLGFAALAMGFPETGEVGTVSPGVTS